MATRIDTNSPLTVNQTLSTDRQTPKTDFGERVKVGAAETAGAVSTAVGVAAPFVPGGAVVSAAVAGVSTAAQQNAGGSMSSNSRLAGASYIAQPTPIGTIPASGGSVPSPTGVPTGGTAGGATVPGANGDQWAFLEAQKQSNMQFLMLQSSMNQESQQYMTLSNILKVRADAAKNTIQNVH